ncbi:hypothetical protein, partial [Xenorhabdus griffiniae]
MTELLKLLYLAFAIMSFSYFLINKLKIDLYKAPLLTFSIIIIWCYFFGIIGFLSIGVLSISIIMILLGVISFYKKRNKKKQSLDRNFYLNIFIVIILLSAPSFLISENFLFTGWDEFSYWAFSIKTIFDSNFFYTLDTPIYKKFKTYPPGQQTLQYFFLYFKGWSEPFILAIQQAFTISCFSFIASCFSKKKIISILYISLLILVFYSFRYDLSHIYVDGLLGAYFASALSFAITSKKNTNNFIILLVLLLTLPLIKQVGLVFAFFIAGLYSIRCYINSSERKLARKLSDSFLYFLVSIVIVTIGYKSWSFYISIHEISVDTIVPSLTEYMRHPLVDRFGATVNALLERVFRTNFFVLSSKELNLSLFGITLLCVFFNLSSLFLLLINRKLTVLIDNFISLIYSFICSIAYVVFLFFCYLVFFSEYEGVRLASFERYAASYYFAWLSVSMIMYFSLMKNEKLKLTTILTTIVILAFFSSSQIRKDIEGISPDKKLLESRLQVQKYVDELKPMMSSNDKSYFIIQNSTGFEKYIYNYLMSPFHTSW